MAFFILLVLFWLLGVLTAMEMATFSARKERMVQVAAGGDRRGTMVNAFQRTPADYLAAIQLVATAANFVVGAMIGANLEAPIHLWLEDAWPAFRYLNELSWILAIGTTTVLALIFTNVLPKHMGFVRANEIAVKMAPIMRFWIKASWPITSTIRKTTKALARLLKVAPDEKFRVTERDIDALLMEGVRAGSLDPTEQAVMRRALRLSDVRIEEAMVPRDKVLWLEPAWSDRRILSLFRESGRSNFVVSKGSLDRVLGVVRAQDWLLDHDLDAVMTPPIFAEPEESLLAAIERLRPSESRLLIVRKGERVVGVLTLNDILGQVVGPIAQT